jgi:hypothetical protein
MVISPFRGIGQKQAFCAFSLIRCRVMAVMDGFRLYGHFRRHDGLCLHPFYVVIFAVALLMGGCATSPSPRGFYANALTTAHTAKLAEDAARQMTALYPPASTYLSLKQPTGDPFGTALIGLLRGKGYALAEVPTAQNQQARAAVMATAGVDFGYVVDMVGVDNCRVTLTVGNETVSRIYLVSNNGLSAIGYWVRKT